MALDERTAAADADEPPAQRADEGAEGAGEGQDDPGAETVGQARPERGRVLGQRPGGQGPGVEHHELAAHRQDRVDRHEREDDEDAMVGDGVGELARERGEGHGGPDSVPGVP